MLVGSAAILETRLEVDDPRAAPAGLAAAIRQAALDGLPGGHGQPGAPRGVTWQPGCNA